MFCSHKRDIRATKHLVAFKARGLNSIILAILILTNGHIILALPAGVSPVNDTTPQLVAYANAEVEFIVGPQLRSGSDPAASWYDEVAARRAKFWAEKFLAEPLLVVSNHYDLPLCLYTEFYRTADPEYQRLARLVADKWWRGPNVNRGLPVAGGDIPPPMYVGLMGLTLYALDGHPEVFGYLDRVTREWMDIRLLGKINAPDIYTDMRDEGYILLAAVTLARTLPDSFPQVIWDNNLNVSTVQRADGAARRARYLADAENVAVNYFGRLQEADGSWLWRAWNPEPALQQKIDARRAAGLSDKFEQPFMVGIYMEAAAALHGLTQSASVKEHLRGQIARHCEHLMRDTYVVAQTPSLTSIPRVLLYFYPRDFVFDPTASDRHLTTSVIHTFGYAYQVTGEAKYLAWGDELWDSCFANVPRDGYRSGLDEFYHLKLFTGEFRSSGRYLARRRGGATPPPPSPSPSPTPAPTPSATPTPTPAPTPSPTPVPTPTPTPDAGAPTTNITSPTGGAQYNAPANITISASASAASGKTITRVDFYAGTTMIGTDTTAPYSVAWSNVAGGNYILTTKATDGSGKSATSSGVQVQIKRSSVSVNKAKKNAQTVSNQLAETLTDAAAGSTDLAEAANSATTKLSKVVSDIQTAYNDFLAERGSYAAAGKIDGELQNALNHALYANNSASSGLKRGRQGQPPGGHRLPRTGQRAHPPRRRSQPGGGHRILRPAELRGLPEPRAGRGGAGLLGGRDRPLRRGRAVPAGQAGQRQRRLLPLHRVSGDGRARPPPLQGELRALADARRVLARRRGDRARHHRRRAPAGT